MMTPFDLVWFLVGVALLIMMVASRLGK